MASCVGQSPLPHGFPFDLPMKPGAAARQPSAAVRELSSTGGEVKVTQASRDGSVDAVACDPDPIRGGKIVIQAKRYTNPVGVSAVRDLYGTVVNEGANKGILVTTSNFGADAFSFAKGKPLTLLDGQRLLYVLSKHGDKAHIDLEAAKNWVCPCRGTPTRSPLQTAN